MQSHRTIVVRGPRCALPPPCPRRNARLCAPVQRRSMRAMTDPHDRAVMPPVKAHPTPSLYRADLRLLLGSAQMTCRLDKRPLHAVPLIRARLSANGWHCVVRCGSSDTGCVSLGAAIARQPFARRPCHAVGDAGPVRWHGGRGRVGAAAEGGVRSWPFTGRRLVRYRSTFGGVRCAAVIARSRARDGSRTPSGPEGSSGIDFVPVPRGNLAITAAHLHRALKFSRFVGLF